jgi:hypothetical protein
MAATVKTRKRAPKKTSPKKRPNKKYILQLAEFRGFMSSNDKTSLSTIDVKNINQRVNNIAMSDDAGIQFNGAENAELQRLMKQYVKDVESVLKSYKSR